MRHRRRLVDANGVMGLACLLGSAVTPVRAQCPPQWAGLPGLGWGEVRAVVVYDDGHGPALYAGGSFTATTGSGTANNIAKWDGTAWSPLGSGISGSKGANFPVCALTVYNGALIAGGDFTTAGGVSANYIAQWDGTSWSPVGSGGGSGLGGTWPTVTALTVYNGRLIAGGNFDTADGVSVTDRLAQWDGASWSPVGNAGHYVNDTDVSALTVYNGALIAGGGQFHAATPPEGLAVYQMVRWDGTSWSSLGGSFMSGTNYWVHALTVYNGRLIVGGEFTYAGGVSANHVVQWDGTFWSTLGGGTTNGVTGATPEGLGPLVYALAVYNGALIVGGEFASAGGISASSIAQWDGTSWSSLGSGAGNGVKDWVWAMTVYNDGLIVGGFIDTAGGVAAENCVRWGPVGPAITQSPQPVSVCPGSGAAFTVSATGVGSLTYAWRRGSIALTDPAKYAGLGTATLAVNNIQTGDGGDDYNVVVSDTCGSTTSASASLTVLDCIETTPPTVSIASPADGEVLTTPSITVSGTASDPGSPSTGVALVEVRVNSGAWQTATGTTNWGAPATLVPGANQIDARSRDNAGNYSSVASAGVNYSPPPALLPAPGPCGAGAAGYGAVGLAPLAAVTACLRLMKRRHA